MIEIKCANGSVLFTSELANETRVAVAEAVTRGAYLIGADLGNQWIIQGSVRSDGYPFFLQRLTGDVECMVRVGCRHLTLSEARKHWMRICVDTSLGEESLAIDELAGEIAR